MDYDIPDYMADLICSGMCPQLAPASSYCSDGSQIIKWDTKGLIPLNKLFNMLDAESSRRDVCVLLLGPDRAGLMDSYAAIIRVLRNTAESCLKAGDWLIGSDFISMEPEDIYWDPKQKIIRLTTAGCGNREALGDVFTELLRKINENCSSLNTDLILHRMETEFSTNNPDLKGIISLLYSWELELLN